METADDERQVASNVFRRRTAAANGRRRIPATNGRPRIPAMNQPGRTADDVFH
jgi:hypothetical protein